MQDAKALGRIVELVRDLRRRCPWDGAQTAETLRPYLVEEVMELDHAIGAGDKSTIRSELGDFLLHLAFQIVLGEESGAFGAEDVTRAVEAKMWRRHPHLFSEQGSKVDRPDRGGHGQWERVKARERQPGKSLLDGLPPNLPRLLAAFRLQERAAGVGFDWPDTQGPLDKVREETDEVAAELKKKPDAERVKQEIGDLLFAVVNVARKAGCDPRAALEQANQRFIERFRGVERLAEQRGIDMGTAGLEVLDELWDETKRKGERRKEKGEKKKPVTKRRARKRRP
jgi:MazG family protein